MGYTHYYSITKEIEQEKWDNFIKDVLKIKRHLPKHSESSGGYYKTEPLYLNGCTENKFAIFDSERILFNGGNTSAQKRKKDKNGYYEIDELGHETFYIKRTGGVNYFCKTARKPYDFMVQAVLLIAKYHFGKNFHISSDGDEEEWEVVYKFVKKYVPVRKFKDSEL